MLLNRVRAPLRACFIAFDGIILFFLVSYFIYLVALGLRCSGGIILVGGFALGIAQHPYLLSVRVSGCPPCGDD